MRKIQKKLLNTALSITGRIHWHSLFFWLMETFPDTADELAKEKINIPQKDMDKIIERIIIKGEWEIVRREAMEHEGETVTPPMSAKHPDR